jgi:hypothetical protein
VPPLGYRVAEHKLVVIGSEAEIVCLIFAAMPTMELAREQKFADSTLERSGFERSVPR